MRMQRAFSIALSLAAVVLSAVLAWKSATASPHPPAPGAPTGGGGGAGAAGGRPPPPAGEGAGGGGGAGAKDGGPFAAMPELLPGAEAPTDAPALPKGAPRHVRFGVVLVTYEGAEGAPDKGARHKPDALSLATKLADEARRDPTDFHATVQRGDNGSTDDVGQVTRGVLEPATEGVLFALPVGGVSGVIDTPRGFWIVKRLE